MFNTSHTYIIAEMAQGYEGSTETAEQLIDAAVASKADAVKLQVFTADELAVPNHEYYGLYKKLEFTADQWGSLIKRAHNGGLHVLADVFGVDGATMLLEQEIDGFKIHSADTKNPLLLSFLAQTGKPLLLSLGGSTEDEIVKALQMLRDGGAPEIVGMHGFQSFPTEVEHTQLLKMKQWQDVLGIPVGFADHIDGDHELRFDLCVFAMGMGAAVLEKHFTLDRADKLEDFESALSSEDLIRFVAHIRSLEVARGSDSLDMDEPEQVYRKNMKKHIVAALNIPTGKIIEEDDIVMKRTMEEYPFQNKEEVLGKKARNTIQINTVIRTDELE
jgi:N,N'-diacetyllegionaminate synthase